MLEKCIESMDVTGQLYDITARMEARKQVGQQYLTLLRQAGSMKDILSIPQEINAIQEEMEAAGSRKAYLAHQSAFSTIELTYTQALPEVSPEYATPDVYSNYGRHLKTAQPDWGVCCCCWWRYGFYGC